MKLRTWIFSSLMCFSFLGVAWADNYTFDPSHTSVNWRINHLGFSTYMGKWAANGTLQLDPHHPEHSKLDVKIKIDSLITGDPDLNTALLSPDFFDVAKYPTATYVSDKVVVTGKNTATVHGTLTLHGVSKPVTLKVVLNKMGANPFVKKNAVGFSATTTIKRSDFGVSAYLPALGDTVKLDIEAEAYQDDSK